MEFNDYINSLQDLSIAIERLNNVLIEKMNFAKDELEKMIDTEDESEADPEGVAKETAQSDQDDFNSGI